MGKWKNNYNETRQYNKNWENRFSWLTWKNDYGMCKICNCILSNMRKSAFVSHEKALKHLRNVARTNFTSASNDVNKLEISDAEIFESSEIDRSSPTDQFVSPLNRPTPNWFSSPNISKSNSHNKSAGIERKALDAISNFYKILNSSTEASTSDFEDSDEAFGRYLGKELKNIKNVVIKKKLKLKILNMVLSTDETADENNSPRPFPIFVSTSGNISFPNPVINKGSSGIES